MDIKHVVNATAVITLGKDMVFRDYVQGAFRMRGLGNGQKLHVFVIPEVRELMAKEEASAIERVVDDDDEAEEGSPRPAAQADVLKMIVAWLVIQSMKSEQTQWAMLVIQSIGNIYRKTAFERLLQVPRHLDAGLSMDAPFDAANGAGGAGITPRDALAVYQVT